MRAVVERVVFIGRWQWEQAAWNEVVMAFSWGMGYHGQLRYRVLPVDRFANIREAGWQVVVGGGGGGHGVT